MHTSRSFLEHQKSKMEIYAEIKKFSFYENNGSIYINAKVIEKRVSQHPHPSKCKFEDVKVGDVLSIKTDREKIRAAGKTKLEDLVILLLNRFLVLSIDGWEQAHPAFNKTSTPKFLLATASTCGILQGK